MSKPEKLSEDIRKVELAGKLRLLHTTACEGYDENALLDQARDAIAAELAAKDAEIASWRVQLDAANELLVRRGEEIARLTEQVAIFGGVVGRLECERNELRAALRPFRNSAKHGAKPVSPFICEGDWVRAVEVMDANTKGN